MASRTGSNSRLRELLRRRYWRRRTDRPGSLDDPGEVLLAQTPDPVPFLVIGGLPIGCGSLTGVLNVVRCRFPARVPAELSVLSTRITVTWGWLRGQVIWMVRAGGRVSYPRLVSVRSSLGDRWTAGGNPGTGVTVPTGRTVHPGDRVKFTCYGQDLQGGDLLWWSHPQPAPWEPGDWRGGAAGVAGG